jgi:hypothetical protein
MKDYEVKFSFELFTITTGVYAETKELAEQYAKARILENAGLDCDDLDYEVSIEVMGIIR